MKNFHVQKHRDTPEGKIQAAIIKKLTQFGWYVKETHGCMFQSGFPDLWAGHARYGTRWIEVKNPTSYRFTPAQLMDFPKFSAVKCGIWVLVSDSDDEIAKLFGPAQWHTYIKGW